MCSLKRFVVVAMVLAALGAIMPAPVDAQAYTTVRSGGRGGTWDFALPLIYSNSATINGQGGSSVKVNSDWGMGFGFGYNITDNFNVNGIFSWAYRSYEATTVNTDGTTRKYNNYMDTSTLMLNGVFYLLSGNITPFVSAGVGVTYVDTNIPTGIGSTACWWDPWYGYVCSSYVPTKTENDISYSAALGIRMDLSRQFSLQGSYNKSWIDISRASGTPDFDSWRVDLLFRM